MADLAPPVIAAVQKSGLIDSKIFAALFLLAITALLRWPVLGDPNYHIDESLYLLVGERMHDGALPYVDIWDRKPFGLFAIYWAITFFGGVHAYQVAAGICVWLTACCIAAIARQGTGSMASLLAGAIYIAALGALAGSGGQAPVFYNLLIAAAALLTFKACASDDSRMAFRKGTLAMLLCGIAITVKQTSAVEGAAFGMMLLHAEWKRSNFSEATKHAAVFALLGVLPTGAIMLGFTAVGYGSTYADATMQTIFLTQPIGSAARWINIEWLLKMIGPFVMGALAALVIGRQGRNEQTARLRNFTTLWTIAATLGFAAVPNWFDHYALPLAAPLALACALLFDRKFAGPVALTVVLGWLLDASAFPQVARTERSQAGMQAATRAIMAHKGNGCLFVFDATPALYRSTGSCLPTAYVFPEHLSNAREAKAIGADPAAETRRILDSKPSVVAIPRSPSLKTPNLATHALVKERLARDYKLVDTMTLENVVGRSQTDIWALKPVSVNRTLSGS